MPTTLIRLNLRGCGALTKIDGICSLTKLEVLDVRGCGALCLKAVPGLETKEYLKIFKTHFETCNPKEEGEEDMEDADLQDVVCYDDFCK